MVGDSGVRKIESSNEEIAVLSHVGLSRKLKRIIEELHVFCKCVHHILRIMEFSTKISPWPPHSLCVWFGEEAFLGVWESSDDDMHLIGTVAQTVWITSLNFYVSYSLCVVLS